MKQDVAERLASEELAKFTMRVRLENLNRLVHDKGLEGFSCDPNYEGDIPSYIEEGKILPEHVPLVGRKYLVLTWTDQRNLKQRILDRAIEADHLDEAGTLVKEHLAQPTAGGIYAYMARVFDLDEGKELLYEVVHQVRWGEDTSHVGGGI